MESKSAAARFVIYRTSAIGDVVLATACLDFLSKQSDTFEIFWIGRGESLKLIEASYPKVTCLDIASFRDKGQLDTLIPKTDLPSYFIDLQHNLKSQRLALNLKWRGYSVGNMNKSQFARAKMILGAKIRGRRKPLPDSQRVIQKWQFQAMVDAISSTYRNSDLKNRNSVRTCLNFSQLPHLDRTTWLKDLQIGLWLAIAPGASFPTKMAPLDLFLEILNELFNLWSQNNEGRPAPGLVFLGSSQDRNLTTDLITKLNWKGPVLNLAGQTNLLESGVVLGHSSCLLSNDSGLVHISEAQNVPAFVLFGPTIESFGFAPYLASSRYYSSPIGCRPCSKHGKTPCRFGDKLCFSTLDIYDIARDLKKHLTTASAANMEGP